MIEIVRISYHSTEMTPYFNAKIDDQAAIAIGGQHESIDDRSAHLNGQRDHLSAIIQNGQMRCIEPHLTKRAAVERAANLAYELRCGIPDITVREFRDIQQRDAAKRGPDR